MNKNQNELLSMIEFAKKFKLWIQCTNPVRWFTPSELQKQLEQGNFINYGVDWFKLKPFSAYMSELHDSISHLSVEMSYAIGRDLDESWTKIGNEEWNEQKKGRYSEEESNHRC